jgi:multiple sugar transport system substrate-binding protein
MRKLLMSLGVCASALALSATAYAETITVWARSDDQTFIPKIVDAFNAAQNKDHVDLQIVPGGQMVQKYAVAAAGGSAPDALSLDVVYTPAFAAAGELKDLTDFAKSLPYFGSLSQAHLSVATYNGRIYGMPFSGDASVLLWNKSLFKKAGLDPDQAPKTWADIKSDAEKVNALGQGIKGFYFSASCGGCQIFTFMPLIWASGGDLFADDGRKVTLDTPQTRAAIAFFRSMVDGGLVPGSAQTDNGTDFFAAFATGKVGLTSLGSFAIGALNAQNATLPYGVTFIPGQTGGWSSFAGGDNFVVSKSTTKMEAVKAFIEFAYTLKGQTILARNGSLPVRGDLAKQALAGLDSRYLVTAEAMAHGRTPYSTQFNDLINSANGPWITMLNQTIFGKASAVDATIESTQSAMQSTIDTGP